MDNGIVIAGNLIVDYIKCIDAYPEEGRLCNINNTSRSIGGCAANTAADLAIIDPGLAVKSIGLVGNDENGDFVVDQLSILGVNTSYINRIGYSTSFTDVMSVIDGQRTFFHARGANAQFDSLPAESLNCSILHIGYALLLDKLDAYDPDYGTKMAHILANARSIGIKTSIDVVSEVGNRFRQVVLPSLQHCDYLIINETEASLISDIPARESSGLIIHENIVKTLKYILDAGVHDTAVIHAPEGGWALNKNKEYGFIPSLTLPAGYIKGSVGAGDAFCAGLLYCLYKEEPIQTALKFAVAAAACNLSSVDATSGMQSASSIWELYNKYK